MQHKEYRKYFIIVVNGINFENCESLHCTSETYTIFYINSTSTKAIILIDQVLAKYSSHGPIHNILNLVACILFLLYILYKIFNKPFKM